MDLLTKIFGFFDEDFWICYFFFVFVDNIFGFIDEILFTPGEIFRFVRGNFHICLGRFSDLSGKIFRFVWEDFQICLGKFSNLSGKIFRFVREKLQGHESNPDLALPFLIVRPVEGFIS